ncbi:PREDICTED: lipid phosphate phosphatase-related protein type 2-like [Pseudopodoces humilis]|uniref:lipid phosphate phosphatase-related protein type 2-like n=1 Tax=Pseudopodoces humilis TaxID=181119 RepID=UPI0006B861F7|nr:PREDICTED: lipid phosphate phosphatase-related protein type 2-like [Pseudopodoces humilis]
MAPPRQDKRGSIVPCVLLVEVGILGGTAALAYQLEFTDAFPVHVGGFFCRDPDFGRPYPGPPGLSRAPPALVYALVTAVPALTSRLAKPAAVLGFAAPPFLLGALRVAEHRNSWGGVLGGFLCGTAIAAFLIPKPDPKIGPKNERRVPKMDPKNRPQNRGGDPKNRPQNRGEGSSGRIPSGDLRENREFGIREFGNAGIGGRGRKFGDPGIWGSRNLGIPEFGDPGIPGEPGIREARKLGSRNLGIPKIREEPGIREARKFGAGSLGSRNSRGIPKIRESGDPEIRDHGVKGSRNFGGA